MDKREIRVTRTINKIALIIISIVLCSFIIQVSKHLYSTGKTLPHSFGMLATFLPLAIVFVLNKKKKYFLARLVFLLLPMITTVLWMFVGSSQTGLIHHCFIIFPIPIVILFKEFKTQISLVTLTYVAFLVSQLIITIYPAPIDSYSNPYFTTTIVGIFIFLSFSMLLFFVSEIEKSEERLQESNLELKEFSRIASHDMREPLRTISSFASLIKKKYGEETPEDVINYLEYIESGVDRLDNLLSDLSDYSSIDINEEGIQNVDLNNVLSNVKKDLQFSISENQALIHSNTLPTIKANESHMAQLFQNLIQNSIKFQPKEENRIPEIRIESTLINGYHNISFIDNGIGIEEKYLNQIFLKFKRLHSRKKYEGSGLGLATCKRIVEKYNGEISVSSIPNEGTTMKIKFLHSPE